jgi:hypothetical protein
MNIDTKEIEKYIKTEVAPKSSVIVNMVNIINVSIKPINRLKRPKYIRKNIYLSKYYPMIKYKNNYYKSICPFLTVED